MEGRNFEIREGLLKYDDVLNKQREVIYAQRKQALTGDGVHEAILDMIEEMAHDIAERNAGDNVPPDARDPQSLTKEMEFVFGFGPSLDGDPAKWNAEELAGSVIEQAQKTYEAKFAEYGPEIMSQIEQWVLLDTVDTHWKEHLLNMDHLKEGIGLRGYAQKDPLREYQREGFEMFAAMAPERPSRDRGQTDARAAYQPRRSGRFGAPG